MCARRTTKVPRNQELRKRSFFLPRERREGRAALCMVPVITHTGSYIHIAQESLMCSIAWCPLAPVLFDETPAVGSRGIVPGAILVFFFFFFFLLCPISLNSCEKNTDPLTGINRVVNYSVCIMLLFFERGLYGSVIVYIYAGVDFFYLFIYASPSRAGYD